MVPKPVNKTRGQVNLLVSGLPDSIHNEVDNQVDEDDGDEVKDEDEESEYSPFEVPASENKVVFTFTNTSNEFHIPLAQEGFDNIIGSEGIMKHLYAVDDTKGNAREDHGSVHNEHHPIIILKYAIMTVAVDKCDIKSKADQYYKKTIYVQVQK